MGGQRVSAGGGAWGKQVNPELCARFDWECSSGVVCGVYICAHVHVGACVRACVLYGSESIRPHLEATAEGQLQHSVPSPLVHVLPNVIQLVPNRGRRLR